MLDRDCFISARVSQPEHEGAIFAANAKELKLSEWVRLVVLTRLSCEDSPPLSLLRQVVAIRILVLNVLFHLAPAQGGLTSARLKEIWLSIDQVSDKKARALVPPAPDLSTAPKAGAPTRQHQIAARLTESQLGAVRLAADAKRITAAEWLRETVLDQLSHEALLPILAERVLALRTVLDDAVRHVTNGTADLDRDTLADISRRTEPALLYDDRRPATSPK
jgi:hypothetical protein